MRVLRYTPGRATKNSRGSRRPHRRGGYSLIETMVASILAAFLGMLLALSCASFGRTALQVECRARIAQEGTLVAHSLACDLGGVLADAPGRTGTLAQYSFTNWDTSEPTVLALYFQGTSSTDVIAVTYQLSGNQLVRTNTSSGVTTTIARYVSAFSVRLNPDNTGQVLIQLTITYRSFASTYNFVGISPT